MFVVAWRAQNGAIVAAIGRLKGAGGWLKQKKARKTEAVRSVHARQCRVSNYPKVAYPRNNWKNSVTPILFHNIPQ